MNVLKCHVLFSFPPRFEKTSKRELVILACRALVSYDCILKRWSSNCYNWWANQEQPEEEATKWPAKACLLIVLKVFNRWQSPIHTKENRKEREHDLHSFRSDRFHPARSALLLDFIPEPVILEIPVKVSFLKCHWKVLAFIVRVDTRTYPGRAC